MENHSQSQQSNEHTPESLQQEESSEQVEATKPVEKKSPHYQMISRGSKTKGASYKHRYVEKTCPQCNHKKAYRDIMRMKVAYSCMKRDCKHKWYEDVGDLRPGFKQKKK